MNKNNRIIIIVSIMLTVSLLSSVCFAYYKTGGRSSGFFKCYYDSSVSSYGYTPHFDAGYNDWNGRSSKVSISKTTSLSNYPDKYYIGNTSVENRLGLSTHWKKDIFGSIVPAGSSDTWLYSTATMYHNTITEPGEVLTYSQILKVASHEVGHTLSMDHVFYDDIAKSVMRQGVSTTMVQSYDIEELKKKWGN